MIPTYKTGYHIKMDNEHKRIIFVYKFFMVLVASLSLYLAMVIFENSVKKNSEIKALKAQIQACESRPPCKRELEK